MTRITVDPGFGDFSSRSASLRIQIIALVAKRDQIPIDSTIRSNFHRAEAERRADALIDAWERGPRHPETEIDAVLAEMSVNADACRRYRQEGIDRRAQMVAEKIEPAPPTVTLRLLDSATGKPVLVTLPREMVLFVT